MKERPILFSSPMVRALLDNRKTMTRRVIKPQPIGLSLNAYCDPCNKSLDHFTFWDSENRMCNSQKGNVKHTCHWKSSYGIPGDRLWVREAWRVASVNHEMGKPAQFYTVQFKNYGVLPHPQPDQNLFIPLVEKDDLESSQTGIGFGKWRPSIHMPRWASRITLEIINVRVERLQDISEEDAQKEGCVNDVKMLYGKMTGPIDYDGNSAVERFEELWNSIHKNGWAKNLWVWVIEFKKVG